MLPEAVFDSGVVQLVHGDARGMLASLEAESVHCVVTSPPYWGLRDYGLGEDALGLEPTPELYVEHIVDIFREVRRVLRRDGTCWLNMGDSYAGSWGAMSYPSGSIAGRRFGANNDGDVGRPVNSRLTGVLKSKDLVGLPWRGAFALQADGWWLRSDIVWSKPNPMPESVTDRPTRAHEYLFLLARSQHYYYDADAIREPYPLTSLQRLQYPVANHNVSEQQRHDGWVTTKNRHERTLLDAHPMGRNKRSVWEIPTQPYPEAHFATFPEALVEPCILAGCPEGGSVLDPFAGSGTTCVVAQKLGRKAIGVDLNVEYLELARKRLEAIPLPLRAL